MITLEIKMAQITYEEPYELQIHSRLHSFPPAFTYNVFSRKENSYTDSIPA